MESKDRTSGCLKKYLVPILLGVLIAVIIVVFLKTRNEAVQVEKAGSEGTYTAYLADDSLTKIASYNVTKISMDSRGNVIYEAGDTAVKAGNGSLVVIGAGETDVYSNAFIIKDKE